MFTTKGSSAYGRGIASNLVSEEQRVKYNAGGRVGLAAGAIPWMWGIGSKAIKPISQMIGKGWGRMKPTRVPQYKTTGELYKKPFVQEEIPFMERAGKWVSENPWWTAAGGVGATSDPAIGTIKGLGKGAKATAKWGAEALTPGWAEKFLPWDVDGEDKDQDIEITDEQLKKQEGIDKILQGKDPGPKEDLTETIKEEKIDLTPSEKEGLKASMMMGAGTGALSAKGDVIDVLKGALLGAGTAGTKVIDPTMEKKYRLYGEQAAERDIKIAKEKTRLANTTEARYDKAQLAKLDEADTINYVFKGKQKDNVKSLPKFKKKGTKGDLREKAELTLDVGDRYFDKEDERWYIVVVKTDAEGKKSIGNQKITEQEVISIGLSR